jgi:DNA/RNA endonuclease YhcR with UshA esterase domain
MDDRTIARLSLICSITGLAVIYAGTLFTRPRITPIASLDNGFIGLRVVVSGQVVDLRKHEEGHIFLKLRDDSGGVISVPIFSRLSAGIEESIELLDVMEVTGEVVLYQGNLEVVPDQAGDVKVVHTPPVRLSGLRGENAGMPVKVQGTIAKREIVGRGNVILTLQEDGEQLPVFIPYWVAEDGLPELHVGSTVRVDGWLQIYNGKLELKVLEASHLHPVEAA